MTQSAYAQRQGQPGISDFVVGNPHEMPLPGFSDALQRWSVPQHKDWFAYTFSDPSAVAVVAASLRDRYDMAFEEADISMTTGAFGALSTALGAILDPGDEVIYMSPPWFFYDTLVAAAGGEHVGVKVNPDTFDLDITAIQAAITSRTRAVIVNSPNNPTGRIYAPETLQALSRLLSEHSERNGRTIYLISDESYSRILFDDQEFMTPTRFYPNSFLVYTYGKTLLTPGQRIGYLAMPPEMPERESLRVALLMTQVTLGYGFPNALLQHALVDLEQLSIDIPHLQQKRDRMVAALREFGYEVHVPQGTFYLLPRSPLSDDHAFVNLLAERDVLVLPGSMAEMPGYFRISLTANDEMIERALPVFEWAIATARA
jgi:aspartate aminotransferase